MISQFLILGVGKAASTQDIDNAFQYLSENLNPESFAADSQGRRQAELAWPKILAAHKHLMDDDKRAHLAQQAVAEEQVPVDPNQWRPYLGHLCVAAGIITLADLQEAITKQHDIDLPLGQILQEKRLLSQTELDGLLMGQRLFTAPTELPDPAIQRLMALELASRDMVKIILMDQRTAYGTTLSELLVKRGWLDKRISQVIQNQPSSERKV